ncbi:MAG: protein translocase subunit SecD [Parcubacteria group bacterium]
MQSRIVVIIILIVSVFLTFFVYPKPFNKIFGSLHSFESRPFSLGLDLVGGVRLVYLADLNEIGEHQTADEAMDALRGDIEARVNTFGVAEPVVQVEGADRLIVELPGIKNLDEAIKRIGETPILEFREEMSEEEIAVLTENLGREPFLEEVFKDTGLTGRDLDYAQLDLDYGAKVLLKLNSDGAELFAYITERNLDRPLAIFLDNNFVSAPIVRDVITDGEAVISGNYTIEEAKSLAEYLNRGALPVPIEIISQQTIGASLGADSLHKSLRAGLYGLLIVALFMIVFYRLPGLMAVVALLIYTVFVLTLYKLIPVTLSLAGIAGFILSLGMAVDANILIFARAREELKAGLSAPQAFAKGFNRAWYSIRDSHVATLLGSIILYSFTTSLVRGFALTLGIGVLMSLLTAVVITRSLLDLFLNTKLKDKYWLF